MPSIDVLAGMSVGIFPLENTTVDDVEIALEGLLGSTVPYDPERKRILA